MFGDVLVPLDGSPQAERALRIAIPLCNYLGSTLRVASYVDSQFLEQTMNEVSEAVSRAGADASLQTDILVRTPSLTVVDAISGLLEETPGTLLCMATHGRGRSELFTGSVASQILHRTSSPVILVGPHCDADDFTVDGTIVVAVDGSSTSESVVPVATAWAIVTHSPVEVVSVIKPEADRIVAASHGDLLESSYVHGVARTIESSIGRSVDFETLHDTNAAHAIVSHIEAERVSMVAMATHGATGLARLTAGSVTAEVIRKAPVPVLVIRPPHLAA